MHEPLFSDFLTMEATAKPSEQSEKMVALLEGRALLWPEIQILLKQNGVYLQESELLFHIISLIRTGKAEVQPAIARRGWRRNWHCNRCFADFRHLFVHQCARCQKECVSCQHCLSLGRARACAPFFFFFPSDPVKRKTVMTDHNICFSPAQSTAVEQLRHTLQYNQKLLFWAVTGAGKTEVLVPIVKDFLSKGKRVLWCAPRKDVVMEVGNRLKAIFPEEPVILQYGKSPDQWKPGSLIVATAHQAYRYFRRFSLAVLDEVDAFPLYGDEALFQGIQRSLAKDAKQIYVTATPDSRLKREMPKVILPVRYHGFPLPVPKLVTEPKLWSQIDKGKPVEPVLAFLRHVKQTDGQALIFVPRVSDVPKVAEWLAVVYRGKALGVTGRSEERDHLIEQVRLGKQDVLVTTTLLERGVTFPSCHVLVLGADHPVFDRSTLMQIAGRVGRKADYQKGIVCFIASVKTEAQIQVKKELIRLNKLSLTKNLLQNSNELVEFSRESGQ